MATAAMFGFRRVRRILNIFRTTEHVTLRYAEMSSSVSSKLGGPRVGAISFFGGVSPFMGACWKAVIAYLEDVWRLLNSRFFLICFPCLSLWATGYLSGFCCRPHVNTELQQETMPCLMPSSFCRNVLHREVAQD